MQNEAGEPRCSACDGPLDSAQHYCRACANAYMREWRKTHRPSEEERIKDIARSRVHVAVERGQLSKEPCERCGAIEVHAHHDDYSRPLDVRWLCPDHHRRQHSETFA